MRRAGPVALPRRESDDAHECGLPEPRRPRPCDPGLSIAGRAAAPARANAAQHFRDRKSTRLNSSHSSISYAVFCLKKKKIIKDIIFMKTNKDISSIVF